MSSSNLGAIFQPRSIAIVGATEKLNWMVSVRRHLDHYNYDGALYAVNLRGVPVFGIPGFTSCRDLGAPVDAAFVMVPAHAMVDAMQDIASAGIKAAIILTSGFAEAGSDGLALQNTVSAIAARHGVRLFGPNCLGYVNVTAGVAASAMPLIPVKKGSVAIIAQSGGLCSEIVSTAARYGVGLSFYATTGNEADISLADLTDYLIDDPDTNVIAICAETIRKPQTLAYAARRAFALKKPIVVLKAGSSPLTREVARAHTGSAVGDGRVFDAVCRDLGMIRVYSLEDLVMTAALLSRIGYLEKSGIGVVSISGGSCTLVADAAHRYGVDLPPLAPETARALKEILPAYASTLNPLDITGGVASKPDVFAQAIRIVAEDPSVCRVFSHLDLPLVPTPQTVTPLHCGVGRGVSGADGIHMTSGIREVIGEMDCFLHDAGIPALSPGIDHTMRALGRISWWSERVRDTSASAETPAVESTAALETEGALLQWMGARGVNVVPQIHASDRDAAVSAAQTIGFPVVLKISSPDVEHKTEAGGVRLNLNTEQDVATAFDMIMLSVRAAAPDARIEGVLVCPMRQRGIELFVGVTHDADWGPMVAAGFGGTLVEVLQDTALRMLPLTERGAEDLLRSLKGAKLFDGYRGSPSTDISALAKQIVAIANAALSLGGRLNTLEVNPLLVDGTHIEALDALAIWNGQPPQELRQ